MFGSSHGRCVVAGVAFAVVIGCRSGGNTSPEGTQGAPAAADVGALGAAGASLVAPPSVDARAVPAAPVATADAQSSAAVPAGGPPRKRAMWATWPVPNPPATGLPNPASYDVATKGVVLDKVTGLMWQRTVGPKSYSWIQAGGACEQLDLAGYHDWRLPSRIELVSIVDPTRSRPSIDQHAFPQTPSDWFWTASVDPVNPDGAAWYVHFTLGYPKTDPTNNVFRIRCVRSADPTKAPAAQRTWSAPRYEQQTDTVLDRGTGLTWQREVSAQTFKFDQARQYCSKLHVGELGGWRVPTLPELLTLVDERTSNPTIDTKAFPKTPKASFWTSSPFAASPSMAWHVNFEYGNALYGLLKEPHQLRCVR